MFLNFRGSLFFQNHGDEFDRLVTEVFTSVALCLQPFGVAGPMFLLDHPAIGKSQFQMSIGGPNNQARRDLMHRDFLMRRQDNANHANGVIFKCYRWHRRAGMPDGAGLLRKRARGENRYGIKESSGCVHGGFFSTAVDVDGSNFAAAYAFKSA